MNDRRTPIIHFLKIGNKPLKVECSWERKTARYTLLGDNLYRRGFSMPLLKCIFESLTKYVMKELHEGYMDTIQVLKKWISRF